MAKDFYKIQKGITLKGQTADPSVDVSNGDAYYNSTLNQFRFRQNGAWTGLGSGSGAGEINAVTNSVAASDTTGWSGTGTATVTRLTSGSPLDPIITTAFRMASGSAADYVEGTWSIPTSLRNRKLKIQWSQLAPTTGEWKVDLYDSAGSVRYSLSTDSSAVTAIPAINGTFTTTFDMDSGSSVKLRFVRVSGSGNLDLTNIIIGPGIQPQGAVVSEWISYTPTGNDQWTTNATYTGRYRRVGDTLEAFVSVVAGATTPTGGDTGSTRISLPAGLTIDTTKLNSGGANNSSLGTWQGSVSGIGNMGGFIRKHTSNLQIELWRVVPDATDYKTAMNTLSASQITNGGAQQGNAYAHFTVPIAEWSGGGTVNLTQNDVEYVSNTSTTDADDTTSFAYGPAGSSFPGNLTTDRGKRVRFTTPILPSDDLKLEYSNGDGRWYSMQLSSSVSEYQTYAASAAGMYLSVQSATDVDVRFAQYRILSNDGTGATWSTLGGTPKWRLKKTRAGSVAGFALATATEAGLVSATNQIWAGQKQFNINATTTTTVGAKLHDTNSGGNGNLLAWSDSWSVDGGGTRGAIVADVPASNNGRMKFYTQTAASTLTHQATLNTNGSWEFGVQNPATATRFRGSASATHQPVVHFWQDNGSTTNAGLMISKRSNDSSTTQQFITFEVNNSTGVSGSGGGNGQINGNGANNAAFGSYSDARLKENIENLPSQLDKIMALRPVEFDYIGIENGHQIGYIAQEMQTVYPDVVGVGRDGMLTITGWDKTSARLVKAMQELKAELDALKAQVNG